MVSRSVPFAYCGEIPYLLVEPCILLNARKNVSFIECIHFFCYSVVEHHTTPANTFLDVYLYQLQGELLHQSLFVMCLHLSLQRIPTPVVVIILMKQDNEEDLLHQSFLIMDHRLYHR